MSGRARTFQPNLGAARVGELMRKVRLPAGHERAMSNVDRRRMKPLVLTARGSARLRRASGNDEQGD
jgi:hypothetical protein